jgi:HEAT repeat protein
MVASLVSVVILPLLTFAAIPNLPGQAPAGVAEVTALLGNPCWQIRLWGADALGQITPPATLAVGALRERSNDVCEEALVRSFALKALAKMGPSANVVVPDLPKLLWDRNWLVRQSAAEALESLGRGSPDMVLRTLPDVKRLLDERSPYRSAFDQYAQGPTAELLGIVPQLIALLQDPRYDVRRVTANALGSVGWIVQYSVEGGLDFLAAIGKAGTPLDAKDKTAITDRITLSKALLAQTEAALIEKLCDGEPSVRVSAVDALRKIMRERAVPPLTLALLGEPHPGVQRAIADALGSIGTEVQKPAVRDPIEAALIQLLGHADPQTRVSAVTALGQIASGTEAGTAKLKEMLLCDPDTRVKTAALEAIQNRATHVASSP